jgi:hypothetical protein
MSYSSEKSAIDAGSVVWFTDERVQATSASQEQLAIGVSMGPMGARFVSEARDASLKDHAQAPPNTNRVGAAIGNVISVDEDSVLCELHADGRLIEVGLPRVLFPENIRWGTPISIRMQIVNGFRTPVVEIRETQGTEDPRIAEMERLIAELPG